MTDIDQTVVLSVLGALGAALMKLSHWAINLWATIRREEVAAATARAAADRDSAARSAERQNAAIDRIADRVDAHTEKDLAAAANVQATVARLEGKIDAAFDWRERTPVTFDPPSERRHRSGPVVPVDPPSERRHRSGPVPEALPDGGAYHFRKGIR